LSHASLGSDKALGLNTSASSTRLVHQRGAARQTEASFIPEKFPTALTATRLFINQPECDTSYISGDKPNSADRLRPAIGGMNYSAMLLKEAPSLDTCQQLHMTVTQGYQKQNHQKGVCLPKIN